MKRLSSPVLVLLVTAFLAAPALADPPGFSTPEPTWTEADWAAFSQNLVVGLATDNDGLRASALQMIVRYGDKLDVQDATFDVVRIYRSHKDERMRRLAAVTCAHMKSKWAVSFLRMSEPFERSQKVKRTIRALLIAEDARLQAEKGTVETGELRMIAGHDARKQSAK